MFRILAALTATILIAGCSGLPSAPTKAAQPDYKYLIGPGDTLNIVVWRNPELSATVPVRPDGRVTTPLVEDITAAGKSPSTLAREMETALKKYLQDPVVTVAVQSVGVGNTEQVRVLGQAAKPATLPYRQNMTVLDVMIAVGGLTEFAAGNRAVLIRAAEDNKAYALRLADLIKKGDVGANVQVLPGDVIIIPENWF
jgi:polysaccharide export outer membrane protein